MVQCALRSISHGINFSKSPYWNYSAGKRPARNYSAHKRSAIFTKASERSLNLTKIQFNGYSILENLFLVRCTDSSIISDLGRLRQENHGLKACLSCREDPDSKQNNNKLKTNSTKTAGYRGVHL